MLTTKKFFSKNLILLAWKPGFLAKVGCMSLTLLLELSKANTDFFQKVTKYQMHGTYARSINFLSLNLHLLEGELQFCDRVYCIKFTSQIKQSLNIVFIVPKLNRILCARYKLQNSLRGTIHINLINVEFAKIAISFLEYFCSFLAWDTLLHSDLFYHC